MASKANFTSEALDRAFRAIEEGCQSSIDGAERALRRQFESGKFDLITRNLNEMSINALCLAMMYYRHKQDYVTGSAILDRVLKCVQEMFVPRVDDIAEANRNYYQSKFNLGPSPAGFNRDELFHTLHCSLLCDDWGTAEALAKIVLERPINLPETGLPALLLSRAILDDRVGFEQALGGKDPFERKGVAYANYPMLLLSALRRNSVEFSHWYEVVYENFKERSKSRGHEVLAIEYGYSAKFNSLVADFQCISACRVAKKFGLELPHATEYVPALFVS